MYNQCKMEFQRQRKGAHAYIYARKIARQKQTYGSDLGADRRNPPTLMSPAFDLFSSTTNRCEQAYGNTENWKEEIRRLIVEEDIRQNGSTSGDIVAEGRFRRQVHYWQTMDSSNARLPSLQVVLRDWLLKRQCREALTGTNTKKSKLNTDCRIRYSVVALCHASVRQSVSRRKFQILIKTRTNLALSIFCVKFQKRSTVSIFDNIYIAYIFEMGYFLR